MKKLSIIALLISSIVAHSALASDTTSKAQHASETKPIKVTKGEFTDKTIVKLNAIVARSLDSINKYDVIIVEIQELVQQAKEQASKKTKSEVQVKVKEIYALAEASALASKDMTAAVEVLKKSGEDYDPNILTGMTRFVERVKNEISSQKQILEESVNSI